MKALQVVFAMVTLALSAASFGGEKGSGLDESEPYYLEGVRVGSVEGYNARAAVLRGKLARVARLLDESFQFDPLLIDGRVMPPVLAKVEGERVLDGGRLREAGEVFRIVEPARIVTVAPSWREYVRLPSQELVEAAVPRKFRERYAEGRRVGLAAGVQQADGVLASQLGELTRVYWGALLYLELLKKGMVSAPVLGVAERGIVVEADRLSVDDRLYELTLPSRFQRPEEWRVLLDSVQ